MILQARSILECGRRWQQMEREADEDLAAGRVERFESGEDFLAALEAEDARLRAEGR